MQRLRPFSRAYSTSAVAAPAAPGRRLVGMQSQREQQQLVLQLYDDPHSEYCAKVKVALRYKGLAFEALAASPCGGSEAAAGGFKARAPLGKIPALVVRGLQGCAGAGDEVVLFESEVINEWLQEEFPEPTMMPNNPLARSKVRLLSRFHDLYLEPSLRRLYSQVAPSSRDSGAVAAAAADFVGRLGQLELLLADSTRYAAANHLTLADCGYPGLLLYAEKMWPVLGLGPLSYQGLPKVAALRRVLQEDAAVAAVLAELEPAAQAWVDSKLGQ